MVRVKLTRRLGSMEENLKIDRDVKLAAIPRTGDQVRVGGRVIEVEAVLFNEGGAQPEITLKPDYRAYGNRGKGAVPFETVVSQHVEEGWNIV